MKPKAGHGYMATAAHFAAESSTDTSGNAGATNDFAKSADAFVYHIDPCTERMKIAYPIMQSDCSLKDRHTMCSFLARNTDYNL
eukprot:6988973-Lingulodinium_polyedra.AAC.1